MLRTLLRLMLRALIKPILGPGVGFSLQRRWLKAVAIGMPAPKGTRRTPVDMHGVAAERIEPSAPAGPQVLLYFHGGGYCVGSAYACRVITGHLARITAAVVYAPDYRLAPEHPHPAALEDALSSYRWLLAQGHAPASIAFAGDSAGAGLALATALAARTAGLPRPAALALLSPWVDLSCSADSFQTHAARDPLLSAANLQRWARAYLGTVAHDDPAASPVGADLGELPPLLIQVGSEEVLLNDSRRLHQRALAAGVAVTLQEYKGMWHDFQLHAGLLRESDAAIAEIGDFLQRCWTIGKAAR